MTAAPRSPDDDLPAELEDAVYRQCFEAADPAAGIAQLVAAAPQFRAAIERLFAEVRSARAAISSLRLPAVDPHADAVLPPGTQVGAFAIERELGRGAFGVVYLARQSEPVRRLVALKVLAHVGAAPELLRRFEAERQVLAQLDHPGIAHIFDAGTAPTGQPFFAMEYLDGQPLVLHADARQLAIEARLRLFLGLCAAVQHAHQRGVIHRDLKPGNVLVVAREGTTQVKVIDFGLAKVLQPELVHAEPSSTELGRLLGTPEYMSPEQASGRAVDTRADVYSLGVMLFELLSGGLPFPGARLRQQGLASVVRILAEEEAPLASSAVPAEPGPAAARASTPRDLRRRLRGDLDRIVATCLHKDREQRYDSAAELAADVRRHLQHEPLSVRPPRLGYVLKKLARRHRVAFAFAVCAVLALVVAAVALVWSTVRVGEARDRAVEAAARAETNAYAAAISAARAAGEIGRTGAMRTLLDETDPRQRNLEYELLAAQTEDSERVVGTAVSYFNGLVLDAPRGGAAHRALLADRQRRELVVFDLVGDALPQRWPAPFDVVAMAVTGDGARLALAGAGGELELRSFADLGVLRAFALGEPIGWGLAFARDDRELLVTVGNDLVVVDAANGSVRRRLPHGDATWGLDVGADGNVAATGAFDGKVRVWDLDSGACTRTLDHGECVMQVRFVAGGTRLVSAGRDGILRLWDLVRGRLLAAQQTNTAAIQDLAVSADGARVLSVHNDGSVRLWAADSLLDLGTFRGHAGYAMNAFALADGRWLTSSWDTTLRVWPATVPLRHRRLAGMRGCAMRLVLHPSEPVVYACSLGGQIAAFDLAGDRCLWAIDSGAPDCHGLVFDPDLGQLRAAAGDRMLSIDPADGAILQVLATMPGVPLRDLRLRGHGELVVALADGDIARFSSQHMSLSERLRRPARVPAAEPFQVVAFDDGAFATVCCPDSGLVTWDLRTNSVLWHVPGDPTCACADPTRGTLLVGGRDGLVRERDARTGAELGVVFRGAGTPIAAVALTADGQRLLVAGTQVHVLARADGRELLVLDGDRYPPAQVVVDTDRGVLVTGGGHFAQPTEILRWPLLPR